MIILSLGGSYRQMVKPLQENFRMKIFFYSGTVNTTNYLLKIKESKVNFNRNFNKNNISY
jgi:hypothetical protein